MKSAFLTEKDQRLYIALRKNMPERRCQNKDHILKVMILAAVACPRFNAQGKCTIDGKIGMFPFVKSASRNPPEIKLLHVKKN
jgi:hypothetical protein